MTDEEYLEVLRKLQRDIPRGPVFEVLREAERRAVERPSRKRGTAWNDYMRRYRRREREILRKARSEPNYPNPFEGE